MEDNAACSSWSYEVTSSSATSTATTEHYTYISRAYIERVPVYKWSCDPRTEPSLSIAERAQRVPASFKSEWSFDDAQRQTVNETSNYTDCRNCLKTGQLCCVNGDPPSNLQTENVQRQINVRTVAVCLSLAVNGAASGSSALHSKNGLSDDAVTKVEAVQANQLNSVEDSAAAELWKKGDHSGMTQGRLSSALFDAGYVKCNSSGLAGDGVYAKDADQIGDEKLRIITRPNEVQDDPEFPDNFAEIERGVLSQKDDKDDGVSVSASQTTDVLSKETEAVVDELVSEVAECKDAESGDWSMHSGRREISAFEMRQDLVDSGDGVPVSADSALGLLKTGQKLDDLSREKCREVSDVGARDVASASSASSEVRDLSLDSFVSPYAAYTEDAKDRAHSDHVTPADDFTVTPDRHSVEKELSDVANGIENLQSWIDSASAQLNTAAADGGGVSIPLGVVQQYASELQNRKSELDQLNAQVRELEKSDKNVVFDERHRLVSIHTQLHSFSDTLSSIASDTVTKDIEDAEHFLDNVSLKSDVGVFGSDREQLTVKLAEEEKRCEEMERRCRGIEDFGRKALKVLRSGATTSRVSDVETRLEKLCRKTCAVQAQLADRRDQATDALSLAADFQLMLCDLRSSFSETERKLNAVDVASTDNVEAMQNQLHEAKAISELLRERLSLVNDLIDYGSELSALTGCEQMAVDAEELSRWHDCLRQNAGRKTSESTTALQQAASRVSDLLDGL